MRNTQFSFSKNTQNADTKFLSSFKSHSFDWFAQGDEEGRAKDDEGGDDEGYEVYCYEVNPVVFDWYGVDVVDGGIEFDDVEGVLQPTEEESEKVADDESLAYEHHAEVDKDATDGHVGGTKRLEGTNHVDAFEHNDEESADDGER